MIILLVRKRDSSLSSPFTVRRESLMMDSISTMSLGISLVHFLGGIEKLGPKLSIF